VPPLFFTNYIILKKFFIKNLFFAQALEKGEIKKMKKLLWHLPCFVPRLLVSNVTSQKTWLVSDNF
jgi:hypothetical protein